MRKASSKRRNEKPAPSQVYCRGLYGLLAALLALMALIWWPSFFPAREKPSSERPEDTSSSNSFPAEDDRFLIPEVAPTSFRNASPEVAYVGSHACIECHRGEHETYLKTTHSRSLAEVNVSHEPANGEHFHEISGRHYRVNREGKALRLREFIEDSQGAEVVLADYEAQYALGSGNYARMYLVNVDNFLIEAPLTWYPRRGEWGMSAGYERNPHQVGFGREIDSMCLYCHAGRVEAIAGAGLRLKVVEMAIGCERCHGPGALHVQERNAQLAVEGDIDDSIVNLRHLPRDRQEDVCSQCHLSALADVSVRGRSKADFRPGMRMSDFVVSHRIDRPDTAMTVSGQIQQMRLSRCYRESQTMTCATCHDPHSHPDDSRKVEYFREKCLSCHSSSSCGLTIETRTKTEASDNCVTCHMPRGPTDIPHFTFTHHRIGIHAPGSKADKITEEDQLVPIGDITQLPELERQRLLGLANDTFSGKLAAGLDDESRDDPSYRALSKVFQNRAREILEEVRSQGLRDAAVEDFFSRLHWRKDPQQCILHAQAALSSEHIGISIQISALYSLGSTHFDQKQYERALPYLEELVTKEHSEISLMLLAICQERKGNLTEAVRLIHEAILASPDRADLHIHLATVYRRMGRPDDAEKHLQMASLLALRVPQPQ